MIEQILNRDFLRDQLEVLRDDMRDRVGRLRRDEERPPEELDRDDVEEALAELDAAAKREAKRSSGPAGYEPPPAQRRREPVPPLDDRAFFSRDPVINIVQSALDEYFEERSGAIVSSETRRSGGRRGEAWPVVSGRVIDGVPVKSRTPGRGSARRLFEKFSKTDAGWVNSKIAEGIRLFRHRAPFNLIPAPPVRIGDRSRLLLVGDWGSGVPRARKVAEQMRSQLDEGIHSGLEQHVIHLGDVYYSGWKREYETRFLELWPVRTAEAEQISSWSVNGNHDMYSGGQAYYGALLADPRFAKQQRSSYFSLQSDAWEILGLDTAWEDADLLAPQPAWVASKVSDSSRKLMLLSHHQLFSPFEKVGKKLGTRLREPLSSGRVRAWFWGHEHRCAVYDAYGGVANARCVGHGGVPVYQWHEEDAPYPSPARYEFRDYVTSAIREHWALFGFAVLDVEGPRVHVRYIDENGDEHYSEDIV